MKKRFTNVRQHWHTVVIALAVSAGILTAPSAFAETVTCNETTLSVSATNIKAEDLIKAVGNECGIRMVLKGEIFTEDVFSVQFENMPIRTGLERILRVVNIPNHMMHFEESSNYRRLVEVDLIGKKGGERELTPGSLPDPQLQTDQTQEQARTKQKKALGETAKTELKQKQTDKQQKNPVELHNDISNQRPEEEKEPAPTEAMETTQQELPEDIQDQIPEDVLEKLKQLDQK